ARRRGHRALHQPLDHRESWRRHPSRAQRRPGRDVLVPDSMPSKLALVITALLPELGAPEPLHVDALEPGAAVIAEPLTGRERDILHLIAQGRVDREIARTLSISPATVKSHVGSIFTKLNVQKRAHAVSRAQRLGLIDIA